MQYKQQEYDALIEHFKAKAIEVDQTQNLIKDEIKQVREKLEILQVIKAREKKISAKNKMKSLNNMKELEQNISNLENKENEIKSKIETIRQQAQDIHASEMQKFKEILSKTEEVKTKIEQERVRIGQRLKETEEEVDKINSDSKSKENEDSQKATQVSELKNKILVLQNDIKEYEKNNSLTIENYKKKDALEKQLKSLESKINKMQGEVDELDKIRIKKQIQLDSAEQEIKDQKSTIQKIEDEIRATSDENQDNIKKIEVYFNRKRRETTMDTPSYTVQASLRRFDTISIKDEIRIKEGDVMASKKSLLLSNVKRTIAMLTEKIKDKAMEVRQISETLKSHQNQEGTQDEDASLNQVLVMKFKEATKEFWGLKMKKIKSELRLKHREEIIDQFIANQKKLQPELQRTILYNIQNLPFDNEIIEHVVDEKYRKPG